MPRQKKNQQEQSKQSGLGVYFKSALGWFKKKASSHHNEDQDAGVDVISILPANVMQNILGLHLPNPDVLSMYQTSKTFKRLFQPRVDALKPLKCVVEGDVDALIALIQDNPGLLFKKGEIKAPRDQTYYNVSPYMLMKFLCHGDMIEKVKRLIPEHFSQVTQAQDAELGRGGSDLVKLGFNPMSVTNDNFNKICAFKTRVNVQGTPPITFPLLENPDGLLYWKDAQGKVNFYYANRDTQTLIPITPVTSTSEEHKALNVFKDSFDAMENNSARRATNKEHQLIAQLMQRTLHRQGICYSDAHGEHYCNSHTPFQLINRYRTSIRLYQEAVDTGDAGQWKIARQYRKENIGMAQGEEMWLLQHICEESRPFYPSSQNVDELKQRFVFYNWRTRAFESVFNDGKLMESLSSDFSIYSAGSPVWRPYEPRESVLDLIDVCRFIEESKTKMIGLALESDQVIQPTSGPQRLT